MSGEIEDFESVLHGLLTEDEAKNRFDVLSRHQCESLVEQVRRAKTAGQVRRVERFDVLEIGGVEKLVKATEKKTHD